VRMISLHLVVIQKQQNYLQQKGLVGKNLARLERLGQGRDRTVYALDKDKVIKVAKNPGGLTQNMSESELDWPTGQIKHYETGLDYAVMERAQPPGEATKTALRHLKKARDESGGYPKHPDQVRADFFNLHIMKHLV